MAEKKPILRKASAEEAIAMAEVCANMETDSDAVIETGIGTEDEEYIYANLPDEERDALKKVDFSVLDRELKEIRLLDSDSLNLLDSGQLRTYIGELESLLQFYVRQFSDVSAELANAMELILNQRTERFGRSTQRSSALFGRRKAKSKPAAAPAQPAGRKNRIAEKEECVPPTNSGKMTDRPKRSVGCAEKVIEHADVRDIDCTIPEAELNKLFGEAGWKEMKSAERTTTEYTVIPAQLIVLRYHLHAYCAADCTDPEAPGVVRAKTPITRPRTKSPISSGLMAYILHSRNSLRIPVRRICSHIQSMGLALTPQRVYENIRYYTQFFQRLQERMWEILLSSRYIQIDETPVRFYDKSREAVRRGYLWVFTTSELLIEGKQLTLFYFAEGRGADVLREVLRGFEGTIGSDGHSAYQVYARESDGKVTNAGCLDHFRKRVVEALRAVPGLKDMSEEEKLQIPAYLIMLKLNEVFRLERITRTFSTKEEREAYRAGPVRDAFDELVETTLGTDPSEYPAGSYLNKAIRYMENQEIYLREFMEDGNISCNNSKCEREFAFFAVLRNQIKMFGSARGAEIAATLESIEQTARAYIRNTRIYYRYLIDKLCPFLQEQGCEAAAFSSEALDRFLPWASEFGTYEAELLKLERLETSVAVNFGRM